MKARFFRNLVLLILLGAALGVASKLLDTYAETPGKIFSGISVWIFICTLIAAQSKSPLRAAACVSAFCISMVAAYYLTAELAGLYYSKTFAYGWAAFAACSPLLGCAAWFSTGRGYISLIISVGIIAAMLLAAYLVFGIRLYDIIIALATAAYLYISSRKQIHRRNRN